MMIGLGEKAGSGVDKIRRGWASQHWRSPKITDQLQPDRVKWVLPMVSLIPDDSLARLKDLFGATLNQFSELEIQALVTADLESAVDNARMRQITGAHPAEMTAVLQGLVGKAALIQEGYGRWTRYRLPARSGSVHKPGDSVHKPGDSVHKPDDSVHKDGYSLHKGGHSLHKGGHSLHKGDHSLHKVTPYIRAHKDDHSVHKDDYSLLTTPYIRTTTPYIRTVTPYIRATTPYIRTTTPYIRTTTPYIRTTTPHIRKRCNR